ncbi:hypothetical protein HK105_200140 [Polyrhizophydium stewartii]|uniref:Phosphatidic acid phosphatase type 2/haloperoxidase domain-containing protein n=1 Tax=Polyrhizophydium stewartii TaxID=2732419 RepID=A0ABR4NKW8_9FUNG|nr:hypothetical protein HK105_004737 [Polyrhizophydium stewartii]
MSAEAQLAHERNAVPLGLRGPALSGSDLESASDPLTGTPRKAASTPASAALQRFVHDCGAGHRWWTPWFVADYAAVLAVGGAWLGVAGLRPFERPADLTDTDLAHPIYPGGNIVSSSMLTFISVGVPLIVGALVLVAAAIIAPRAAGVPAPLVRRFTLREAHTQALGLLLAVLLTSLITDVVKAWAGRLRPDFLARCQWSAQLQACTGDRAVVEEGRRSFPSGHASASAAGMTVLAVFLGTVTARFVDCTALASTRASRAWRVAVPALPLLLAAFVGISRTQQYVHHPTDVIAGAALGVVVALLVHVGYVHGA